MAAGDQGRWANAGNLLSQSARFLLSRDEASGILDEVEAVVCSEWYRTMKSAGVSEQDTETLSGAFAYPGFRLEGEQPIGAVATEAASPSANREPAPRRASKRKRTKAS